MKTKRGSKKGKARQAIALSQIFIMLVATVAFAVILAESASVNAATNSIRGTYTTTNGQYQWVNDDNGDYVRESDGQIHELGNTVMIGTVDANNKISFTKVPEQPPANNPAPQTAQNTKTSPITNTPANAKPKAASITSFTSSASSFLKTGDNSDKVESVSAQKGSIDVKNFVIKGKNGQDYKLVKEGNNYNAYVDTGKTDPNTGEKIWAPSSDVLSNEIIDSVKSNPSLANKLPTTTDPSLLRDVGWKTDQSIGTEKGAVNGVSVSPDGSRAIDSNGKEYKWAGKDSKDQKGWKETSGSEDLSRIAGKTAGGHLTEALVWAAGWASIVQIIGATGVIEKNTADALTVAGVGGILVWKGLVAIDAARGKGPTFLSKYGGLIGVGVAAIIFWLMYKKTEKRIVSFECLPFEAPLGGAKCEECNKDIFRPCSEYRCKSLGGGCELLNPGTGKELCAWKSKFDVKSATIEPLKSVLYPYDLKYIPNTVIRPPQRGVKIVTSGNGCLQAFTPLVFGITTEKPTQCRIDYNHTNSYTDMQYLFGGENYYSYNHTQRMKLPTPSGSINDTEAPELKNDGTYSLYVRCQDANGNQNVDEFVFSFCVDPSEDTTPPSIEKASIISGSPVRAAVDTVPLQVYTNEPADCKWSRADKPYESMENNMSCADNPSQVNSDLLYTCNGNLTAIKDKEDNKFFFRCKDKPGKDENERNVMVQSWPSTNGFVLKGSQPLTIASVAPNGTLSGSTTTVTVNLQVETSHGAQEGKAICMFSPSGTNGTYINMFETDNYISKQSLDLTSGSYRYYFKCNDAGGNTAENSTAFTVAVDKSAPRVTRVYKEVPDALKIITDENAECVYSLSSCNFDFNSALKMIYSNPSIKNVHFAEWKQSSIYYVKCRDLYGNEPSPDGCSIIASAVKLTSDRVA